MTSTMKWRCSAKSRITTFAAALLLASVTSPAAMAATVAVSSTCTFVKAVKTLNVRIKQTPCTHSGTFGSNDTVTVPSGNFNITSDVNITRSMTIRT